jgi:hypothetical protein
MIPSLLSSSTGFPLFPPAIIFIINLPKFLLNKPSRISANMIPNSAGIPSVVLPLWADHYSYAQTAEYLGVGIWPNKKTAPDWEAVGLAEAFLEALSGNKSVTMRQNAKAIALKGHEYGGRKLAAQLVAEMAAGGK